MCAVCAVWPRSARRSGRSSSERFPAQRGEIVSAHEDGPTGGRVQSGHGDRNIIGWVIFHRHGSLLRRAPLMGISWGYHLGWIVGYVGICWDMLGYVGICWDYASEIGI